MRSDQERKNQVLSMRFFSTTSEELSSNSELLGSVIFSLKNLLKS